MIGYRRYATRIFLVIGCLSLLTGCPTRLAPEYSPEIVKGLASASNDLMQLFAEASAGTEADTFKQRENAYNTLIAGLETLALQVRTRPRPESKVIEEVNEYLQTRGVPVLDDGLAPSAVAIQEIADTVAKMRDTDRKQGVTSFEVTAFKGQALVFLDQALTYEKFLER